MQLMKIEQNYVKSGLGSLLRSAQSKYLVILAFTVIGLAATFLHAESGENHSEHGDLAGTWIGNAGSTLAPALVSYIADGRVIFSRPVTVTTRPGTSELVSTGHGEWKRTGNHEFVSTVYFIRSGPSVDFTGLVKLVLTISSNRTSDQLAVTGTVYIYDANGNQLASFPQPGVGSFTRIVAGQ